MFLLHIQTADLACTAITVENSKHSRLDFTVPIMNTGKLKTKFLLLEHATRINLFKNNFHFQIRHIACVQKTTEEDPKYVHFLVSSVINNLDLHCGCLLFSIFCTLLFVHPTPGSAEDMPKEINTSTG